MDYEVKVHLSEFYRALVTMIQKIYLVKIGRVRRMFWGEFD